MQLDGRSHTKNAGACCLEAYRHALLERKVVGLCATIGRNGYWRPHRKQRIGTDVHRIVGIVVNGLAVSIRSLLQICDTLTQDKFVVVKSGSRVCFLHSLLEILNAIGLLTVDEVFAVLANKRILHRHGTGDFGI